jgi:hypothetical protein
MLTADCCQTDRLLGSLEAPRNKQTVQPDDPARASPPMLCEKFFLVITSSAILALGRHTAADRSCLRARRAIQGGQGRRFTARGRPELRWALG